jgi:hypothetical protein
MKYLIPVIIALCCPFLIFCQDITGHWKGTIFNDNTQQTLDYEIVISNAKGKLSGFSYTSYMINDAKYYGVKKINVRIAKDGKIIIQDAKLVENNNLDNVNNNVIQLNILSLASIGNETILDGIFVTNPSKNYKSLTGKLSIKKTDVSVTQAELLKYLQKTETVENLTVAK